ncbi:MAG: adenylyl-sulfate kinase [Eubacterium sp.]|nr:adenylyl-sulfate kinase [Eubacterium sp.]
MKGLLKFITCGSVDDGKSTLIGHMLYDAKLLFADQEQALQLDSRVGSTGGDIDYSLLLDGLMAEREQGITIDVAYRYFSTEKRSFIVADTPGHEEYTRNMAVGASYADLAVILVDASQGVLVQTRRHTRICAMMGIRHFVFAVNKMDLVDYDAKQFEQISRDIKRLVSEFDVGTIKIIPISATQGDNITQKSVRMSWYEGTTLLDHLENVDVEEEAGDFGFALPVQRVSRPDHTFRGFQGQIESGEVKVGDEVTILPSKETATVDRIISAGKEADSAGVGEAVSVCLDKEIDVSRGCVITKDSELRCEKMFTASILWMDQGQLHAGENYILRLGTQKLPATILRIKHRIDVNTGDEIPADAVRKNELAVCDISVADKLVFNKFEKIHALGSFILINRVTNMTSACGTILHSLRRGDNIFPHKMEINRELRENQKGQKAYTIWLTGLSGAGKSTIANELEKRFFAEGKHTMTLDGDNVRGGLCVNLGFKEADRIENIRRVAEVSKLMNEAGIIVIASFVSPYERDRQSARDIVGTDRFIEVYVSTSLEECEKRDVKGLYKKARAGEIPNFTGVTSVYEEPENPDIVIDTAQKEVNETVDDLFAELKDRM